MNTLDSKGARVNKGEKDFDENLNRVMQIKADKEVIRESKAIIKKINTLEKGNALNRAIQ